MSEPKSERLGAPDWFLLGATLALVGIGILMIYSSTLYTAYLYYDGDLMAVARRQLQIFAIGVAFAVLANFVHYRHLKKLSIAAMVAALIALLILVLLPDNLRRLEIFRQSLSPVEPAKLAIVIYLAHWLSSRSDQLKRVPYGLLPFTIIVGATAGLVVAQPDISEATVIVLVAVAMFYVAGADTFQFLVGLLGGGITFWLVLNRLNHAVERVEPFWESLRNPLESSEQQLYYGLRGMASGGVFGLGPGNGWIRNGWVPALHSDAIFSLIGEELGLIGCLIVLGLYSLVVFRGLRIAARAPGAFARLLAVGVTSWIAFQALINMAAVTGTIPYTGITLPFISQGGTSLFALTVGIGILLGISRVINGQESSFDVRRSLLNQLAVSGTEGGTRS
jgi:cell division protein FtsW